MDGEFIDLFDRLSIAIPLPTLIEDLNLSYEDLQNSTLYDLVFELREEIGEMYGI